MAHLDLQVKREVQVMMGNKERREMLGRVAHQALRAWQVTLESKVHKDRTGGAKSRKRRADKDSMEKQEKDATLHSMPC